jgi:hypothetical protein
MNATGRTIPYTVGAGRQLQALVAPDTTAEAYAAKLLTVSEAQAVFKFKESTFLRLRKKHKVQLLPGKMVHVDDIIAALEHERLHV